MAPMPSSGPTDRETPPQPWTRRYAPLLSVGVIVVLVLAMRPGLIAQLWRAGLRPCRNLDERVCADLGATDCQVWKTKLHGGLTGSSQPHDWPRNKTAAVDVAIHKLLGWDAARQDNPLCFDQLDAGVYPTLLAAIRAAVAQARSNSG
jgi:hypothetical protein